MIFRRNIYLYDIEIFQRPSDGGCHIVFIDHAKDKRFGFVLHHIFKSPFKCFHHTWRYKDDNLAADSHMQYICKHLEDSGDFHLF